MELQSIDSLESELDFKIPAAGLGVFCVHDQADEFLISPIGIAAVLTHALHCALSNVFIIKKRAKRVMISFACAFTYRFPVVFCCVLL